MANGLVLPNGVAVAMDGQEGALGAASALLGLGQFGAGAIVAPIVGIAGSRDALPMALTMAVAGTAALVVGSPSRPARAMPRPRRPSRC